MEFKENELINETLDRNFETWSHTLNTANFVPAKYLNKIDKLIYSKLQRKLKQCEIFYLLFLEERGYKLNLFEKLRIWFSGLKPLYEGENQVEKLNSEICLLRAELEKTKSKRKKRAESETLPTSEDVQLP